MEWIRTLEVIEAGITAKLHIGAQIYISLNGQPLLDLGVGEVRSGAPLISDTLMAWFSCTKPIVAVALGQLWEDGKLDLDDRVSRFVPEFAANGKGGITLRHLLTHTGGIRRHETGWPIATWEEILTGICEMPLDPDWKPGQRAGYHLATSWFVLGEVVRRIDGRPCAAYLREEIFEPLEMHDSWLEMTPEQYESYDGRRGVMHRIRMGDAKPVRTEAAAEGWTRSHPGASCHGPIRELGRFYEMLLFQGRWNGVPLLSPQTVEALTSRHRVGMRDETFRQPMDWGLGFILNSRHYGHETIPYGFGPHASRRTFGHGGSQSSISYCDPEHGLVVAAVFNGMPGESRHHLRNHRLNAAIYEDLSLTGSDGQSGSGSDIPD